MYSKMLAFVHLRRYYKNMYYNSTFMCLSYFYFAYFYFCSETFIHWKNIKKHQLLFRFSAKLHLFHLIISCIMNITNSSKNDNFKTICSLSVWAKAVLELIVPERLFGQNVKKLMWNFFIVIIHTFYSFYSYYTRFFLLYL